MASESEVRKRAIGGAMLAALVWVGSARSARAQEDRAGESAEPTVPVEASAAPAVEPPPAATTPQTEDRDIRTAVPDLAYAYTATGAPAKTVGAQAYGLGVGASGQRGIVGGGISVWGAPVDRITVVGDGQRDAFGNFAPSVAVIARLLGKAGEGWSLGALGKFKVDGFAAGPMKDEIESEIEAGALVSYGGGGWHLDANAIGGVGTGDDGEVDVEARLRLGHDLGKIVRVGLDSQARVRLAGPQYLPNGRTWDFVAGPQIVIGSHHFFGTLTAGPTTVGLLTENVGFNTLVSVGGSTL